MKSSRVFTAANVLSGSRIVLVPVLLALAWGGQHHGFLALLALSLLTDGLDGYVARRLNQTSDLGAKLDSWGDLLTYGTMILGLYWLWPAAFEREFWFLAMGLSFYLLSVLTSLFKFHELPSYHTRAAKAAALLMAPAYFMLTLWDMSLPFRLVVVFHVWVTVEELLITLTLRRKRYNVPSFFHARQLARRARARLQARKQRKLLHRERSNGGDR